MRILGLSAFYHDSAAALVEGGRIVAAAQEERFTRKRHDSDYPANAIARCLERAGLTLDEVDRVAFYDKPFLRFERLLETCVAFAPRGFRSFRTDGGAIERRCTGMTMHTANPRPQKSNTRCVPPERAA